MDPVDRPSAAEERARYETHRNDPSDAGYREFLSRLSCPLAARLPAGAHGLDYGSGPGPTLSVMLQELGFRTAIYDPFFAPNPQHLEQSWDFITCSETAEHFYNPSAEFDRIDALLKRGGWLALMTGVRDRETDFASWWYTRDPTHVCFYRPATLEWIAHRYNWGLDRPSKNVALYYKPV